MFASLYSTRFKNFLFLTVLVVFCLHPIFGSDWNSLVALTSEASDYKAFTKTEKATCRESVLGSMRNEFGGFLSKMEYGNYSYSYQRDMDEAKQSADRIIELCRNLQINPPKYKWVKGAVDNGCGHHVGGYLYNYVESGDYDHLWDVMVAYTKGLSANDLTPAQQIVARNSNVIQFYTRLISKTIRTMTFE